MNGVTGSFVRSGRLAITGPLFWIDVRSTPALQWPGQCCAGAGYWRAAGRQWDAGIRQRRAEWARQCRSGVYQPV